MTHLLGAGQFVEFIVPVKGTRHEYYVKCGHTNELNYVWVFIAQLVEHCSANAEAMGSNPVEAPKTFFGHTLRLLK